MTEVISLSVVAVDGLAIGCWGGYMRIGRQQVERKLQFEFGPIQGPAIPLHFSLFHFSFMKMSLVALFIGFAIHSYGQTTSNQGTIPQDTPYTVVQKDANSQIWERTTYEQLSNGDVVPHVHRYQEIATGLNFKDPDTGEWEESSETIELIPGGAAARHGQHKVTFAADLATFGAIDVEMPDGQHLQSHLLGLSYFDRSSGQSVFIAQVTNSIGQLVSSNQVWYDNAFTGVKAGVRYTYTRGGFEQDVILEEQPPAPEVYGLDSGRISFFRSIILREVVKLRYERLLREIGSSIRQQLRDV